jgi:hypothetical protein
MTNLRAWQLNSTKPFSLPLAADARLSRTDYTDDQVWELHLGAGDSPALALQTQYGGRAGLVSIVPMWQRDSRAIYQAQAYAKPSMISAFAPGYLRAQAKILATLSLDAEYWVMESHAVGARYTLTNSGAQAITVRVDLFSHVIVDEKEQKLSILALQDGHHALALGQVGNLAPLVILEGAHSIDEAMSPRIGATLTILPQKSAGLRWVHAGLHSTAESLALARGWLAQDWDAHFDVIRQAAQAIPRIETGKADWDAVIASAYHQLVQSFLKPTGNLPFSSFIATRQSWQGYSARGDGSDHHRAWNGQEPTLAYLSGSALAAIDPDMAKGLVRNYLAAQAEDGWIDRKPGLGGQRQNLLCMPILARLVRNIYWQTEDSAFLTEVFSTLQNFLNRWFQPDMDADQDGLPEWQSERQTGYVALPTFGVSLGWAQNADIRYVESPDLAAYLLSEAVSLREIAKVLKEQVAVKALDKRVAALQTTLDSLWQNGRYVYRDRDTHTTTEKVTVIEEGRADEEQLPAQPLDPPSRLIVRVIGGGNLVPRTMLTLDGLDADGQTIHETADSTALVWSYGRGVYTSQHIFAQIDRVKLDGMSRAYHIEVETLDTTDLDINALLPLWSRRISGERAAALSKLATDKKHFWRPNGVTMCTAQDPHFKSSNADGCGGVWLFWLTLIGEGLIDTGYAAQAAELVKRVLTMQTEVLKKQKRFWEFYDSDSPQGLGERGHLAGIVPLYLLTRVLGVQIVSGGKVWAGGDFVWDKPVTVNQHGVTVQRSKNGTKITFPSGYKAELPPDAQWQAVIDPQPAVSSPIKPLEAVPLPKPQTPSSSKSVKIEVQYNDDD